MIHIEGNPQLQCEGCGQWIEGPLDNILKHVADHVMKGEIDQGYLDDLPKAYAEMQREVARMLALANQPLGNAKPEIMS